MKLKSEKGFSLVEVGVGLVIITIFLVFGITMLRGTYNTYRLVEQKSVALNYLIKAVENELIDSVDLNITDSPNNTTTQNITEDGKNIKISLTNIQANNMILRTRVEPLDNKNGKDYSDSKVKLVTATIEYYTKSNDENTKREMTLQTLKIGGD